MNREREVLNSKESPLMLRKAAALSLVVSLAFTATGCTFDGESKPAPTVAYETTDPEALAEAEAEQELMDLRCEVIPDATLDEVEELYADTWMPRLPLDMEIDPSDVQRLHFEKNSAIADTLDLLFLTSRRNIGIYLAISIVNLLPFLLKPISRKLKNLWHATA